MAEQKHYFVALDLECCFDKVHNAVTGSVTGTLIGRYDIPHPQGGDCIVLVYEKHYVRAGNRLTLTVVLDNFYGGDMTEVCCMGGGGGQGLCRFDWGAAENFEDVVHEALRPYRI